MTGTDPENNVGRTSSAVIGESTPDLLRRKNQALDDFFSPETVAVIGATERLHSIRASILPDNRDMLHIFGGLGFSRKYSVEEGVIIGELNLLNRAIEPPRDLRLSRHAT
jgi:hypothetical protein